MGISGVYKVFCADAALTLSGKYLWQSRSFLAVLKYSNGWHFYRCLILFKLSTSSLKLLFKVYTLSSCQNVSVPIIFWAFIINFCSKFLQCLLAFIQNVHYILKITFYSKLLFEVSTLPSSFYSKFPLCLKGFHMLVARYTESLHCRLFICLSVLLFA